MSIGHGETITYGLHHFGIIHVISKSRTLFGSYLQSSLNLPDSYALAAAKFDGIHPIIGA